MHAAQSAYTYVNTVLHTAHYTDKILRVVFRIE